MEQPYTDPSGRSGTLVLTGDRATSGIRHDSGDCDDLAAVSPDLDAAYCTACGWQCRISGAWWADLLAATKEALTSASATPPLMGIAEDDPAVRAGLEAVQRLTGTKRTEAAGMAYIVGSIDAARAEANWKPWWLEPVIPTQPSDEYYEGVRDGIRAHATISGGELLVGALRKPIATVMAEVDAYQAERKPWCFG